MKLISQEMLATALTQWAKEAREGKWAPPTPDQTNEEIGKTGAETLWPMLDSAQQENGNADPARA